MAVVDPSRDGDIYLDYAAQRGLRISHVLETHIHADFASGARELAERSGAELWLSAYDAGETYEVGFAHAEMFDGESVGFGSVRIQALHTPGHTPEHLSFLVFDQARSADVPMTMLRVGRFPVRGVAGSARSARRGGQARVGEAEKDAESRRESQERWKLKNDPRITRIGMFLRKTSLDELPQINNVVRGEMSFVGPRPERPYFVKQLCEEIPYYNVRHSIKPGITGWAQVRYQYGASVEDA